MSDLLAERSFEPALPSQKISLSRATRRLYNNVSPMLFYTECQTHGSEPLLEVGHRKKGGRDAVRERRSSEEGRSDDIRLAQRR